MAVKLFLNQKIMQLPPGSEIHTVRSRLDYTEEEIRVLGIKSPEYTDIDASFYTYDQIAGKLVILRVFDKIEIDYSEPLGGVVRDKFGKIITKEDINRGNYQKRRLSNLEERILSSVQEDKISNEGTVVGNLDEANGVKSLTPFPKEGELITKKIMPVKLTSGAADGSLLVNTSSATELTSIFGTAPAANGTLKKIVTSGSPQAVLKQMQKTFKTLSPQKIRQYASTVSVNPSKTIESLKPEKDPKVVSVETSSKIYKDKLKAAANSAAFDLDPFGAFSGLARSKQNLAGQFVGTLLNAVGTAFGSILNGIKLFGDNPTPSMTANFPGGFKELIEEGGAQTNLSSYVNRGSLVSVGTPKIEYVLQNSNQFMGYATSDDYEFTFVNSTEELISEFKSSRRGPDSKEDDAIGGLFVHETARFTGPPEKANVKKFHEALKRLHLRILTKEIESTNTASDGKTAAETALERISIYPNRYALNSHYVILTDGSLQRGRPIDKGRSSVSYPRFNKTALQLTILSGYEKGKKINAKQFETYDRFLKAWFAVFPDCGVYANEESTTRPVKNSFDVRQSVKSKFRYEYRYDNLDDLDEFPTKVERVITRPTVIAKTSSTNQKPISFAEANKQITDTLESKRFNNDVTSIFNKAGAAMASLNGDDMNAAAAKYGAENLPKNDLKAQFDKDYQTFQSGMKERNKELNKIIGKVNTNNSTVKSFANKITSNRRN